MNIKNCCNNLAIIWGNFSPIPIFWNKIIKNNLSQFQKIRIIIKNNFPPIPIFWNKIIEKYFPPIPEDWDNNNRE